MKSTKNTSGDARLSNSNKFNRSSRKSLLPSLLPAVLPPMLMCLAGDAMAQNINISNHWFRDYLDFGQNKGIFAPGAVGLTLTDKNGNQLPLPFVPFPDFDVVSNHGAATSTGGSYMITAAHNRKYNNWIKYVGEPEWGISKYYIKDYKVNGDFAVTRLNKYVVETAGVSGANLKLNEQQFRERYSVQYNGKKQVLIYRTGAGYLEVRDSNGKKKFSEAAYHPELRGGSIYVLNTYQSGGNQFLAKNLMSFDNETTGGDSGSAALIWDNVDKKWVAMGTLYGIGSNRNGNFMIYNKWSQEKVDEFTNWYTHSVDLNKGNMTFAGVADNKFKYSLADGKPVEFRKGQDVSLKNGGTVTLTSNLDLGTGGFIFDENNTYKVEGSEYTFKGAGVNVGKGSTVEWNVKGDPSDNLHKIGEGILRVNVAQGNNLKTGNGTVELNAEKSFNQIYLASGASKVKLLNQNGLNADNKFNGVYFTRRGGNLDVNGFSQTFERIAASDFGAAVSNSSTNRADINFKLPEWKYDYHGQFKDNLNVKVEYETAASDDDKFNKRHLVLDGGMDIKGDVSVKNAQLTMQGMPENHAVLGRASCSWNSPLCQPYWIGHIQEKEKAANEKFNSHYRNNNQISSLEQPDWATRTYNFGTIRLDNAALGVGRNSWLTGNIEAKDSKVQFGGNVAVFRDEFSGENVTASGNNFDFRQKLVQGTSVADETIHFEGNIKAENSQFTSYMKIFSASFDLNNSKFESMDKNSSTEILEKGIDLKNKSTLILGDIYVEGNQRTDLIKVSDDSKLSVQDVNVANGLLHLPDNVANGTLNAVRNGFIHVDHWTLNNNNLVTDNSSLITIKNLKSSGTQTAQANLSIVDQLYMTDLNPNRLGAGASEWIGLDVGGLTLQKTATIKADFSNDYLSLNNIKFDKENTLVRSTHLVDQRNNKNIEFNTQGKGVSVSSNVGDNRITFSFARADQAQAASQPQARTYRGFAFRMAGPGAPTMSSFRMADSPVMARFMETTKDPEAAEEIKSIISHNESGGKSFQEVAIVDALSMEDADQGAAALESIVERTEDMKSATARTLSQSTLVAPVRTAIDSRLASLRRSARAATASYTPVAAIGAASSLQEMARASQDQVLNNSVFVDVSGSYQKDGTRKDQTISTNLGYDRVFRQDQSRYVLGGAMSLTKVDNTDTGAKDDGLMYSLTGYFSYEQKEGFEMQSYLTAGFLNNDRSYIPEINLGEQKFNEDSFMLMSSNYFKYHIKSGEYSIRPMILADFGWNHVGSSESDYLKRDGLNQTTVDLGVGVEFEGYHESFGYLIQATARHNVYTSDETVGVNLRNADGYITYDIPENDDTTFNLNGNLSKRIRPDMTLDLGLGASANTSGAMGVNGNVRLRWHF